MKELIENWDCEAEELQQSSEGESPSIPTPMDDEEDVSVFLSHPKGDDPWIIMKKGTSSWKM